MSRFALTARRRAIAAATRCLPAMRLVVVLLLISRAAVAAPAPRPEADRRCAQGVELAARPRPRPLDLARADLYLAACPTAADAALRTRGAAAQTAVTRALRASDLSPVEVDARPAGVRVTVDTLPGDAFTAPAKVWLPAGRHRFTAVGATGTAHGALTVSDGKRAMIVLELPRTRGPAPASVDFAEDAPTDIHAGAPPAVRHDSLLPARYRKGLKPRRR
jgi:hypothetical protein